MLHITGSMKTLKGELQSAKGLCLDIIGSLKSVDSNTNLTKTIGIFVVQMPEYKILAKDSEAAKNILRRVCSGELNPKDALAIFECSLSEVEMLQKMLESFRH